MSGRKCEICEKSQSKYKCPSCLVPYCSLGCFRKHKEIPCGKSSPLVEGQVNIDLPQKSYQVDEPTWIVAREQLQLIAESSEIQDALKDGELQKLIQKIDCCKDPEDELAKAMEGQSFLEFTEKILSIVNPQ